MCRLPEDSCNTNMYSFREMRIVRRFLCSRSWAPSICHEEANTIRSRLHNRGNGAIQTTLGQTVFREYHHSQSLKSFGYKSCTGTFLGLSFATSFLAAGQRVVKCDSHAEDYGFQGSQHAPELADVIAEDFSSELEPQQKLLNFIKRYWWPTVFLLTVIVGYPYPKSLLPNTLLLMWSTKPSPASIYLWLKKRRESSQISQGALDRMKDKVVVVVFGFPLLVWAINPIVKELGLDKGSVSKYYLNSAATVMHVEVQDYMLFCLAKVTYLTSNATMVGVLGDWWVVYSSSSRITALGLSLDNVPNLDNIAKDLRSKKEELEAEFKKVTEAGLKKYKTWIGKLYP